MGARNNFFVSSIALLAIGILVADARRPQKLLSSTEAKLGELKYQVGLKRGGYYKCGGALISEKHVLTAAHCFNGADAPYTEGLVIRTGTVNIKTGGESHYASHVKIHPDWVRGTSANRWRHDIAVVTLTTPAVTNSAQKPIGLASSNITTRVTALLGGWGQMQRGIYGTYPDILRKTPVTILPLKECNDLGSAIFDTQMCSLDGKDTGICEGDSGSPLVYNNEVVGIVSFGVSCGIGYPDIYTRVWAYKSFITEAMTRQ